MRPQLAGEHGCIRSRRHKAAVAAHLSSPFGCAVISVALQGEGVDRLRLAVQTGDGVVRHSHRRTAAPMGTRIDCEGNETVGVDPVSDRGPRRVLRHVDRSLLAVGSGPPTPVMTLQRGVSNRTSIDGIEVPPPPMITAAT